MSSDSTLIDPDRSPTAWLAGRIDRARRTIRTDDLLQHGGIMSVAVVASGAFNYGYQLLVGRALGPEQYGVFGALFGLFYLVNVLGRGLRFSASRFAAELSEPELEAFHRGFLVRALLASTAVFLLLALASPAIARFLGVGSPWLVVAVAATLPFGLSLTVNQGTFQGRQRFLALGSYRIAQSGVKFAVGVGLVLAGFGVFGALGGLVAAATLLFVATTIHLVRTLEGGGDGGSGFDYRRAYRYVGPAVLAGFCLTVPANVDVIVVKHVFSPQAAGLYTSVSVLGKILVFLPMGITTALFPKISDDHTSHGSERMDALLNRALVYSAAVAGAGALLYWLAPGFVLGLFYGSAYTAAAPLLRWYGLAILCFVLAVVVLNFQLARDRLRFVYGFALATVAEIGLLWAFHASMVQVIQVILVVNAALLAAGLVVVKR